ncbi:SRPBCC family protein [Alteromonas facilis]|uniref:SRPBCC family protein n=1 Tax=Alteromonas facilis TaxID=2048004 RepID=UPI000C289068|nr:SRPBCC family protein [Alteromonas facilis]
MLLLKRLVIGLCIALVALYVIGMVLPSKYTLERSVVIEAPASAIYDQVVDLRQWKTWGVWFKRDPDMTVSYSGPDRAVGMRSEWQSETQGNGAMEITDLQHDKRIEYRIMFPDMDMQSTGTLLFEEVSQGVKVTWMDSGDVGDSVIYRYFGLFMDNLVGPDFEAGLANLKVVSENLPR